MTRALRPEITATRPAFHCAPRVGLGQSSATRKHVGASRPNIPVFLPIKRGDFDAMALVVALSSDILAGKTTSSRDIRT